MATCTPIPLLDFFCDGIGAIIESGYQGMAALEGAKAAVESISAVAAQSKERAQMALAIEKEEEAARLAAKAGEFQGLADEESGNAALEEAEGRVAGADAEKDQLLGEEKSDASDREEALTAVDEEVRLAVAGGSFGPIQVCLSEVHSFSTRYDRERPKIMPKQLETKASPWRRSHLQSPTKLSQRSYWKKAPARSLNL